MNRSPVVYVLLAILFVFVLSMGWERLSGSTDPTALLWGLIWIFLLTCLYFLVRFIKWAWTRK